MSAVERIERKEKDEDRKNEIIGGKKNYRAIKICLRTHADFRKETILLCLTKRTDSQLAS